MAKIEEEEEKKEVKAEKKGNKEGLPEVGRAGWVPSCRRRSRQPQIGRLAIKSRPSPLPLAPVSTHWCSWRRRS
jgi:hypothetical protein